MKKTLLFKKRGSQFLRKVWESFTELSFITPPGISSATSPYDALAKRLGHFWGPLRQDPHIGQSSIEPLDDLLKRWDIVDYAGRTRQVVSEPLSVEDFIKEYAGVDFLMDMQTHDFWKLWILDEAKHGEKRFCFAPHPVTSKSDTRIMTFSEAKDFAQPFIKVSHSKHRVTDNVQESDKMFYTERKPFEGVLK